MKERLRISGLTGARRYLALYRANSLADFTTDACWTAFSKQTQWSVDQQHMHLHV
ncbi:hypothetical protein [Tateyamaria sp.]|uniref:hypothetical protein n=1 Tax=Tateyamaria sp. TaxID=1929288 RepID=UPI00329CBB66